MYTHLSAPPPERAVSITAPGAPMDHHEKMRIRAAAYRATQLYPGSVGELISRELLTWEEFGYRLGAKSLINRLIRDILATARPTT